MKSFENAFLGKIISFPEKNVKTGIRTRVAKYVRLLHAVGEVATR
jgi:hypothetical protein